MSNLTQALELLDSAASESPSIPWLLDWAETIMGLRTLVVHPEGLHQRELEACGPAAFFRLWFSRDPLGAATFGYRLLKSGSANIGPLTISPGAQLLQRNYAALRTTANAVTTRLPGPEEWMLLSALRDSENILIPFHGDPDSPLDHAAGVTLPSTIMSWLEATNIYSMVTNHTDVAGATWESLQALNPSPIADVLLLMYSGFYVLYPTPSGAAAGADWLRWPNHYIQLISPVAVGASPGWMKLSLWTWGRNEVDKWTSQDKFISNYFGPIIAYI